MILYYSVGILLVFLGASILWNGRSFDNESIAPTNVEPHGLTPVVPLYTLRRAKSSPSSVAELLRRTGEAYPPLPRLRSIPSFILGLTGGVFSASRRRVKNQSIIRKFLNPLILSKYIFIFSILFIFVFLSYQSFRQYEIWTQDKISIYLLPPYNSIAYFIFYISTRFFAPYLISLVISILFLFSAKILNKKYQGRFFYPEELYFGALAIFLVSHPGWLIYLVSIIFIYLLLHVFLSIISHFSLQRLSLYYLWLPIAIFVILISEWLKNILIWQVLKI